MRFFNLYRRGLAGLAIGDECFLGDECLLDLAEAIRLEDQVTLAERVLVLTHTNVGYPTTRCSPTSPPWRRPWWWSRAPSSARTSRSCPGVRIGSQSFVAAGSVVTADVPPRTLVAGVPARAVRPIG